MKKIISFTFVLLFLFSCSTNDRTERNLTSEDLEFISNLGLLELNDSIVLFESNGGWKGLKESGNFITTKTIASYWIEDNTKELNSAKFDEIDSITLKDLVNNGLYSSYLKIYKHNGESFNVYVDADSLRTYDFFNEAIKRFEQTKNN